MDWEDGACRWDFNGRRVCKLYPKEGLEDVHTLILYMNQPKRRTTYLDP